MLNWLNNLKLSIVQWVGVMAAGAIGVLVFIVKLQGSKIHKLQVKILEDGMNREMDAQNKKVSEAYTKFTKAYKDYKANGGKYE